MLTLILNLTFSVLAQDCVNYSVRCECFKAIPNEGYEISFVETCDQHQEWWKTWGQVFDTEEVCMEAAKVDKDCLKYSK